MRRPAENMLRIVPLLLCLALTSSTRLAPSPAQSASGPLPVETLLSLSSSTGGETPRWAPGGDWILLGGSNLRLIRPEGGALSELAVSTGGSGHFLASAEPRWSPDGRWISYVSDKSGTPEIWLWSPEGGQEVRLTANGGRLIKGYSWSPDGGRIAFSGNRHGQYDVWTVEVPSGAARRLTDGPELEVYPAWSPDSRSVLFVRLDGAWMDHTIVEVAADGGEERAIVRDEDFFDYGEGGTFGYPLVSPAGATVLFPSYRSGWTNYWSVPRSGGEPRQFAAAEADQTDGVWSPDGTSFAWVENHGGTYQLRTAPAHGGESRIVARPASGIIGAPQWSPDGNRISYTLETPTRPGDLIVHTLDSGEESRLTDSMPIEGVENRLITPTKVEFQSGDGLTIPSYLYRPPEGSGDDDGRHPAIVWTHGGPTSQWEDSFEPAIQYFAQRGYVVLLPNVRGSSGYGRDFEEANDGCWGKCDFADAVAAAEYLRSLPHVHPERIGTTGTSYGGFMSCAAVSFGGEIFQAVIAASGYCDRVTFFEDGEFRHLQQLRKEMGRLDEYRDRYLANSPYYHIADAQIPVFVLHGEGRYPGSPQMMEFFRELQRLYKPARYKAYPGENFYVSGFENRKEMLADMQAFFDYYLLGKNTQLPGVGYLEELEGVSY